jgi:hypothetical protein
MKAKIMKRKTRIAKKKTMISLMSMSAWLCLDILVI